MVVKLNLYGKNPHPVDIDIPNLKTVGILTNEWLARQEAEQALHLVLA